MFEPNPDKHYIFETSVEAFIAYDQLPEEIRMVTEPPRQSHGCWIIDKYFENEEQE